MVIGDTHIFALYGEFVARYVNDIFNKYVPISRGRQSTATEQYSTVMGTNNEKVTGEDSTVSRGFKNTASGDNILVSGR